VKQKLLYDSNLSENIYFNKINCMGDLKQNEEGGYMREMIFDENIKTIIISRLVMMISA
jgi:hypothetical protein